MYKERLETIKEEVNKLLVQLSDIQGDLKTDYDGNVVDEDALDDLKDEHTDANDILDEEAYKEAVEDEYGKDFDINKQVLLCAKSMLTRIVKGDVIRNENQYYSSNCY